MKLLINGNFKTKSTLLYDLFFSYFEMDGFIEKNHHLAIDNGSNLNLLNLGNQPLGQGVVAKHHLYDNISIEALKRNNVSIIYTYRNFDSMIRAHYFHFCKEKFRLALFFYIPTIGFMKFIEMKHFHEVVMRDAEVLKVDMNKDLNLDILCERMMIKFGISLDRIRLHDAYNAIFNNSPTSNRSWFNSNDVKFDFKRVVEIYDLLTPRIVIWIGVRMIELMRK